MSLLLLAALAAAPATFSACSWDRPGVDPFMGDVVAAVDRYPDIAPEVRERLKRRMAARQYDDLVSIRRDSISGKQRYDNEIRDMHFGAGSVCSTVSRHKWTHELQERGLVYCEAGHCILVPTVCRNVSRITRRAAKEVAAGGGMSGGEGPVLTAAAAAVPDVPWMATTPLLELPSLTPTTTAVAEAPAPAPLPAPTPWWGGPLGSPDSFGQIALGGGGGGGGGGGAPHPGGSPPDGPPGTRERVTVGLPKDPRDTPVGPPPSRVVPEPGTWALMGLGLALLLGVARRRQG